MAESDNKKKDIKSVISQALKTGTTNTFAKEDKKLNRRTVAKEDKKRYKDIIQAGFDKNIYYTNSSQLPVDYTDDPFEALDLQDELQCKYTGGTVLHLYMKEKISSIESCRKFVKNVITNFFDLMCT